MCRFYSLELQTIHISPPPFISAFTDIASKKQNTEPRNWIETWTSSIEGRIPPPLFSLIFPHRESWDCPVRHPLALQHKNMSLNQVFQVN